jgi:antitoxin HicB
MKRRYTVVLLPDAEDGGYVVTVPALPGCVTQAEAVDEALVHAKEVIELYLEEARSRAEYIPVEPSPPTIASVEVDVHTEMQNAG